MLTQCAALAVSRSGYYAWAGRKPGPRAQSNAHLTQAIGALFVNGVKGTSALQISRDLNINPKSAFVLLHKLREAMGSGFRTLTRPNCQAP